MKRLLVLALAGFLNLPVPLRAVGPDDQYIQIYELIQEGDQLAASSQTDAARQRYSQAHSELKKLQTSYPNWNKQLIEFRLRTLESKLAAGQKPPPAETPQPGTQATNAPASPSSTNPPSAPPQTPPTRPAQQPPSTQPSRSFEQPSPPPTRPLQPPTTVTPAVPQPEADDRDQQIQALRQQVGRLQNDKAVLEAKLREALAAQPASIDAGELARAEERISGLEKEKEVLRVSLERAESNLAEKPQEGTDDLRRALTEARQKLTEQNDTITALRQEKTLLQQHLQAASKPDSALQALQAENTNLRAQLAAKTSTPVTPASTDLQKNIQALRAENETLKAQVAKLVLLQTTVPPATPARADARAEQELASTKAALQSSRDSMNSLQVRLRTLQEERDRLDNTRRELETKLASTSPPAAAADSARVKQLERDREDLKKQLDATTRQLAANRTQTTQNRGAPVLSDDAVGLRARLAALEANKVPYTSEELALFKKPQETVAITGTPLQATPAKELPASAAPLLAEAQRASSSRRFDEAEKKYLEVLKIDETNVPTLQRLAAVQLEQSKPKEAEANLKRALEANPKEARTLLLMGIAKFDQNKFDEAFDALSRSAQADPQNAETQNYLGITLSQKGQRAAAETALRKAIQLSPNYASAHYNLAVVYATQQPPFLELARYHYQKAIALGHPRNPDVEKLMDRAEAAAQK